MKFSEMPAVTALLEQWRNDERLLRERFGDEAMANFVARMTSEAERALRSVDERLVTLGEAAEFSGFSTAHIGRLVRSGRIENFGRKHAPLVRFSDLPIRHKGLRADAALPNSDRRGVVLALLNADEVTA